MVTIAEEKQNLSGLIYVLERLPKVLSKRFH